jgi:predicted acyltransferase (DUF342 family)
MSTQTVLPGATNPANRGNLRLKSLSLRELNESESLSLAIDVTVQDERLQFTSSFDTGTTVNMFSAKGDTMEMTTLSVGSILAENISASGNFALNALSVGSVTSDVIVDGGVFTPLLSVQEAHIGTLNIFGANTLSVGGNAVFKGGNFSIEGGEGALTIERQISCGSKITVQSSLSIGGHGDIADKLSIGSNTTIAGYTSVGGYATIQGAYLKVKGDLSVGGDDTTLDTNLSVSGALAVRQTSVFDQTVSVNGNLTTASRLSVGSAVRLSSILNVMSVSTFHARMSVHGPFDVEGTTSIGGAITAADTLSVQGLTTIGTLSAGTSTLNSLAVRQNLSVAGDLIVEGNTITLNTSQVDIEDPIIEIGQGLSGETLAGIKIIKDTVAANNQSGFFRERASDDGNTPSFFAVYEDFNDSDTLNVVKTVGNFRASQLSTSSEAFLGGDLSVGGDMYVAGAAILEESLSLNAFVHLEGDLSVGGNGNVDGNLEMNGSLSTGSGVISGGDVSVGGTVDIVGITQIASKLSVSESTTLASDLSVASDVQIDGKTRVAQTLSVGNFSVVDGSLSISGALISDDYISVSGDVTLGQSLSVSDVAVMTPSGGSNLFVVNTASSALIQMSADNVDVVHQIEFDELPVLVTVRQSGKTDLVYNSIGTATAPPITFDPVIEKYVLPLQYIDGTVNPTQVPQEYEIVMSRPYVSKAAFKIRNLLGGYNHDLSDVVPKDMFTEASGHSIPTLSVSGDIITGSAISVGHDLHCHGNTLFSNATKKVGIRGKLSVNDDVNVNERLIVGGGVSSFLSIGSDVVAAQTLSVAGDVSLASEMSVGQNSYFEESVFIKGNLSVQSSLEVSNNAVFNDSMSIAGLVVIDDDLSVSSSQVIGVDLSIGAVLTTQMLSVQKMDANNLSAGTTFIETTLTNSGTSDFFDVVQLGSTLSASGPIYGTSTLSVGANADFASTVLIDGELSVTSSVTFNGDTTLNDTLDVEGTTRINQALSVTGASTLASTLSVGGSSELTGNVAIRGIEVVNSHLSVGRHGTIARELSVGDTITGSRNLSVGGLVLDRERNRNRYYLLNHASNSGLQVQTSSAGQEFLFLLTDGRLISRSSYSENGIFIVKSIENVQVEWFEVNSTITDTDFVEARQLADDSLVVIDDSAPGTSSSSPVLAGLTALSVGHNMTIGKNGESTFLSIGSSVDITGRTQIMNTLSVSGDVTLASALSTSGDMDVSSHVRVGGELSVAAQVIIGSTLSIHGDTTLSGTMSVQGDLDVFNPVRFADTLSVSGDMDVKADSRIHGSLSVQGLTTIDDAVSISGHLQVGDAIALGSHVSAGGSATIGSYLSVHTFAGIGGYMEVKDRLSVGGDLALVGKAEMDSTLSINGSTFVGDSLEVEGAVSIGGDSEIAGQLSIGGLLAVTGTSSVGGNVILSDSLSVASLLVTPSSGNNTFTLTAPITSDLNATELRIELQYPHTLQLDTNSGFVSQSPAQATGNGTFETVITNAAGITQGVGQINGFKLDAADNANVPQLRFMTEHEVLKIEWEDGSSTITVLHNNVDTPGLTGGKRAPTLSVGGRIILLEDLSVGFDTTIEGSLSVANVIIADTLSIGTAFTSAISTQKLFVAESELASVSGDSISVGSAWINTAFIYDFLSVAGPLLVEDNVTFTGQTLTLSNDLSVGGDAQLNLISVANLHVNMLSVSGAYASELSVHTLFVQQVTTTDPDESFDFQDDAHFQGDLTIEGKLYVKDILYTGSGGTLAIENVASMTIEDNLSIAGHIHGDTFSLGMNNTPSTSTSPGTAGLIAFDTQHLYLCIAANLWRRIALSAF